MDESFSNKNVVALLGTAQGTYSVRGHMLAENHWEIPAAWKAVVHRGRVSEWRVYADNDPVWKYHGREAILTYTYIQEWHLL